MKYKYFIIFLSASLAFSQSKDEKELRVSLADFPEIAQHYFDTFSDKTKYLRFYYETDGTKESFEAKFKIKKRHYSIEFDTIGKLEDIEILVKQRQLNKKPRTKILQYLEDNYKKFRILKLQKQYVNTGNYSDKAFIERIVENPNDRHTHFEIIAEIKTNDTHELREFTFDNTGIFEHYRKVTSSSYEHALY